MKVGYEKPVILFEDFELNTAIASGCTTVVTLGPEAPGHSVCDEYKTDIPMAATFSLEPAYANFYEEICSCYTSAGNTALFTS